MKMNLIRFCKGRCFLMKNRIERMTQEQAEEIAFHWHYEGEYSFYDMEADEEDLQELLSAEARGDAYYSVIQGQELVGFFCFFPVSNQTIEIGLGMKPELTGKGKGQQFVEAGIQYIISKSRPDHLTLSVATFNQRAIKVYKKAGFVEEGSFLQETNGGRYLFIKMNYQCY